MLIISSKLHVPRIMPRVSERRARSPGKVTRTRSWDLRLCARAFEIKTPGKWARRASSCDPDVHISRALNPPTLPQLDAAPLMDAAQLQSLSLQGPRCYVTALAVDRSWHASLLHASTHLIYNALLRSSGQCITG